MSSPAREQPEITAADEVLVIAGTIVVFGDGWRLVDGDVPAMQSRVVTGQGGIAQLANERSGWVAFTVRRSGFTDVYTAPPDGRRLRYVISVTDQGAKTTEPTATTAA